MNMMLIRTQLFKKSLKELDILLMEKYEELGQDDDIEIAECFLDEHEIIDRVIKEISKYQFHDFFNLIKLENMLKDTIPEFTVEFYAKQLRFLYAVNEGRLRKMDEEMQKLKAENDEYKDIEHIIENKGNI